MQSYQDLYRDVMSIEGRQSIGDDLQRQKTLEAKLDQFVIDYKNYKRQEKPSAQSLFDLPLKSILDNSVTTMVNIIEDIHGIILKRHELSSAGVRRQMVHAVTRPDRRMYVGLWIVFAAFILYFLDASV